MPAPATRPESRLPSGLATVAVARDAWLSRALVQRTPAIEPRASEVAGCARRRSPPHRSLADLDSARLAAPALASSSPADRLPTPPSNQRPAGSGAWTLSSGRSAPIRASSPSHADASWAAALDERHAGGSRTRTVNCRLMISSPCFATSPCASGCHGRVRHRDRGWLMPQRYDHDGRGSAARRDDAGRVASPRRA